MKAIFIENYQATEAIASRVRAFKEWATFGRPGDGSISPVFVMESGNGNNVLITFDRTAESTSKDTSEVYYDNELASLWFNDILVKENIEVFKELGGGKIMYADEKKSTSAIESFVKSMMDCKSLDQISLESLRPLIKSDEMFMKYNNIVPAYEHILYENIENESGVPDVVEVPSYDDGIELADTGNTDSVEVTVDNAPEEVSIEQEPSEPVYNTEPDIEEPVVNPVLNGDAYKADEPAPVASAGAVITESEVELIREIIRYLDEEGITILELLDSIKKFKMIVKQLMPGHKMRMAEEEQVQPEPVVEENTPEPETKEPLSDVEKFFNQLDEVKAEQPEENSSSDEEPVEDQPSEDLDLSENPYADAADIEEPEEVTPEDEEPVEPMSEDDELVEARNIASDVNSDKEFFEAVVERKDKFSKAFLESVATVKYYDKIMTGVDIYNDISVREYRARKLGLI